MEVYSEHNVLAYSLFPPIPTYSRNSYSHLFPLFSPP